MNTRTYIESGVLETYLLGLASDEEVQELMYIKREYPEVALALTELEIDMERMAGFMAISPPPTVWEKIDEQIDRSIAKSATNFKRYNGDTGNGYARPEPQAPQFIEVEAESQYMRISKVWKWVFAAVFVLGKIFLATAIYFYLENRQAQEQIKELKSELRQQPKQLP